MIINMRTYTKFLFIMLLSILPLCGFAQSVGDKLFAQGQQQQQIMTLAAQRKAITYFTQASKAYDSAAKKTLCQNQIKICQNTIKAAPWKKHIIHKDGEKATHEKEQQEAKVVENVDTTELSISASALELKAKGEANTITVNCNRKDWKVTTSDNWITYTINDDKLTVIAAANDEDNQRTGKVTVSCGKAKAELLITQKTRITAKSLVKGVSGFFGGSKKKKE